MLLRFRLVLACALALQPAPLAAQSAPVLVAEQVLGESAARSLPPERDSVDAVAGSGRFVAPAPAAAAPKIPHGIAAYGPFRVLDGARAALVDATDERSPRAFQAMLAAYPKIRTLVLIECPGTEEDRSNLRLGRMIRARGLSTHVPAGGSVRSGAVELFLAGVHRQVDQGAEFAVHSWADDEGHEPRDYPANAPQNQAYLSYYREMGMTPAQARAFYDMTNSVPNSSALWLDAGQMAAWVQPG